MKKATFLAALVAIWVLIHRHENPGYKFKWEDIMPARAKDTENMYYEVTRKNGSKVNLSLAKFNAKFPGSKGHNFQSRLAQIKTLIPDAVDWTMEDGAMDAEIDGYALAKQREISKSYETYRRLPIDELKEIYGRSHRVSDTKGMSRNNLIADILRAQYGDGSVNNFFDSPMNRRKIGGDSMPKLTAADVKMLHRVIDAAMGDKKEELVPGNRCAYCGQRTQYNTCSDECRRASNEKMSHGNFANQSDMRQKLNNGNYFPKPKKKMEAQVEFPGSKGHNFQSRLDAAFTKSFGKGMKKVTRDAGSPAFVSTQAKAIKALMRLDAARQKYPNNHPKVREADKAYVDAVDELRRAMRARNVGNDSSGPMSEIKRRYSDLFTRLQKARQQTGVSQGPLQAAQESLTWAKNAILNQDLDEAEEDLDKTEGALKRIAA